MTVVGVNVTDKRYIVYAQNQGVLANLYGSYDAPAEWYATARFNPSFGGAGR